MWIETVVFQFTFRDSPESNRSTGFIAVARNGTTRCVTAVPARHEAGMYINLVSYKTMSCVTRTVGTTSLILGVLFLGTRILYTGTGLFRSLN